MRRLLTAALGAAVTLGLLVPSPAASAFDGCPDPGNLVQSTYPYPGDVVLGPTATQTVSFTATGYAGCLVEEAPPEVRILTPHQQFFVTLQRDPDPEPGWFQMSGSFVIDPAALVAEDAGGWLASYEVMGDRYDKQEFTVRRETRLSFNAGPEPVRNGTITYTGTLTRADWERGRYRAYRGEELEILALDPVGDRTVPNVAIARPSSKGRYHVRQPFPGANRYQARFNGDGASAPVTSRVDAVAGS